MGTTKDPRRFGGIGRVFGEENARRIFASHVTVVGMGGVGSWAVEALARSGVGRLTLIDGDRTEVSNTNRQLHALEGNYGRPKAEAMKERCLLINPQARIDAKVDFVTAENIEGLIPSESDWVIDCIDDLRGKAELIAWAKARGILIACAGGAAARTDPGQVTVSDLARAKGDPLLGKVRTLLRREHGFPAGSANGRSKLFGVPAVYSTEPLRQPGPDSIEAAGAAPGARIGVGAFAPVTATAGLRLAALVLNDLAGHSR
ncbi:MAG: ThiF domain-containing protein [Burkholderia sp.]|jgi:tRNA threonylcarbamoyladenosine dehydratase